MSSSGTISIQQDEAVGLALPIIAAVFTLFRLAERMRQRRLWFDDAWAALALIFNMIECVTNYVYLHNYAQYSQAENIALYYVILQFFCAVVWASRISILFTVFRLTSPFSALRKVLLVIFVAFLVTWGILFGQSFWICESEPGWKSDPRPQCELGPKVAIARIITDVLGDALLIIIPCQIVYKVRLSRSQKIRLISIFSASAITTVVCLVHAYYVFTNSGIKESVTAIVETSVCLIVANLSVVVAFFFRIGTEETTAFSPSELKSVVTFGSQPLRQRARHDPLRSTVVDIETTTVVLDDFGGVRKDPRNGEDTETLPELPTKSTLLAGV